MANDLPPGYKLREEPVAPAGGDALPPGYKLREEPAPPPTREQEIRAETLRKLLLTDKEGNVNREPGYPDRITNKATWGVMGPIQGVLTGAGEALHGGSFGEGYRGGYRGQEDYVKRAEENSKGVGGHVADLVGSTIGGGAVKKGVGLAKQALQQGIIGGIEGAAHNADDPTKAVVGAGVGAGINAGTTGLLGGLMDRFLSGGAKKEIGVASRGGNAQQMKTDAGDMFETLKNAGIKYSDKETAPLAGNVAKRLADEGFNAVEHSKLIPVLEQIGGTQGRGMTWDQLRSLQTQISDLKAHSDPRLRRIAGELAGEVDNFLNTAKPTMPASSVAAGVNPAKDVQTARDLYATGKYSGKIEGMADVAASAKDPTAATEGVFKRYSDASSRTPTSIIRTIRSSGP